MTTIQKKINEGGSVLFERATYKITKQLIIPANTVIDLNGARLQRKASIQSIFINKVTKNTTMYNGAGNIMIINGTLEGMGGYSYDNLVTFFHSHDIRIENVIFQDSLCHALELNSTYKAQVVHCRFIGYNLKNTDYTCKELIQIDHAGYSGFVLSGSNKNSQCYDGTHSKDISISKCIFNKSNTRDYPYACIGNHSQLNNGKKHENIRIYTNEFNCKLDTELRQACISLTNMKDVRIYDNTFYCRRVARIYSKDYSYDIHGKKVTASEGDGLCQDITIENNTIFQLKNDAQAFQQYNKSSKKQNHTNIVKQNNVYEYDYNVPL